jgi:hypothetical protein
MPLYLSDGDLAGLRAYRYGGVDRSLLTKWVYQPFWSWVVQFECGSPPSLSPPDSIYVTMDDMHVYADVIGLPVFVFVWQWLFCACLFLRLGTPNRLAKLYSIGNYRVAVRAFFLSLRGDWFSNAIILECLVLYDTAGLLAVAWVMFVLFWFCFVFGFFFFVFCFLFFFLPAGNAC